MAGQSLDFCDNDALSCHCQPYKGIKKKSDKNSSNPAQSMLKNKDTMKMIGSFTILRISSMAGTVGMTFTTEELLALNKKLNKVKLK